MTLMSELWIPSLAICSHCVKRTSKVSTVFPQLTPVDFFHLRKPMQIELVMKLLILLEQMVMEEGNGELKCPCSSPLSPPDPFCLSIPSCSWNTTKKQSPNSLFCLKRTFPPDHNALMSCSVWFQYLFLSLSLSPYLKADVLFALPTETKGRVISDRE